MKRSILTFILFIVYPMTLQAGEDTAPIDTSLFDELPIATTEVNQVTQIFWNAKSIQDKVKSNLPEHVRSMFAPSTGGSGCDVKNVVKTEGSADTCQMPDDPSKMAKFIYNFNLSCSFGNYQVAVCSREENKLLNQLKVSNPEKLVSEDNPFDLDSTM